MDFKEPGVNNRSSSYNIEDGSKEVVENEIKKLT